MLKSGAYVSDNVCQIVGRPSNGTKSTPTFGDNVVIHDDCGLNPGVLPATNNTLSSYPSFTPKDRSLTHLGLLRPEVIGPAAGG